MEMTAEQERALDAVGRWLRDRDRPWFYLAGYAGTGKTTLAKHVAELVSGRVEFGAPTGKAAQVLRRKGCDGAATVHRLIYQVRDKSRARLEELEESRDNLKTLIDGGHPLSMTYAQLRELDAQIREERDHLNRPSFGIHPEARLRGAALLVLDECSMVDDRLARDVLSLDVPVLALGDPAQLPPVRGSGYFTQRAPDALLTDVRRQALDSPVLWLATRVREGRALIYGRHGSSNIVPFADLDAQTALCSDVVLTGHNVTRRAFNLRMRELRGFTGDYPVKGEPLIALNNRHDLGIYNGSTLRACGDAVVTGDELHVRVAGENVDELGVLSGTLAFNRHRDPEIEDRRSFWEKAELVDLDWAYALTVHKAQGSQWSSVVVADDGFASGRPRDRRLWLYTAITRAADQVVVALR
jgi:exodeoxyribonuclease-5